MRERVIESHLVTQVKELGGIAIKFTSSANRGVPDRVCLFPGGVVIFVECKAPGRTLDPLQIVWRDRLKRLGMYWAMVASKAEVDALMRWYQMKWEDLCSLNMANGAQ